MEMSWKIQPVQAYQDAFAAAFASLSRIALSEHTLDCCLLWHLGIGEIERAVYGFPWLETIIQRDIQSNKCYLNKTLQFFLVDTTRWMVGQGVHSFL